MPENDVYLMPEHVLHDLFLFILYIVTSDWGMWLIIVRCQPYHLCHSVRLRRVTVVCVCVQEWLRHHSEYKHLVKAGPADQPAGVFQPSLVGG